MRKLLVILFLMLFISAVYALPIEKIDETDIKIVIVDLNNPAISIKPVRAGVSDGNIPIIENTGTGLGCETVSSMAERTNAIIGINGGFFGGNGCQSVSLTKINNVLIQNERQMKNKDIPIRSAIGIKADGSVIFDKKNVNDPWTEVFHSLGGGPKLVTLGKIDIERNTEGFQSDVFASSTKRTAVGLTLDRKLIMLTSFKSMTLEQLAKKMIDLGSIEAMNFDGGSSTSIYMKDDSSFTSGTRPVATGLFVYYINEGALQSSDGSASSNPITSTSDITHAQPFYPPKLGDKCDPNSNQYFCDNNILSGCYDTSWFGGWFGKDYKWANSKLRYDDNYECMASCAHSYKEKCLTPLDFVITDTDKTGYNCDSTTNGYYACALNFEGSYEYQCDSSKNSWVPLVYNINKQRIKFNTNDECKQYCTNDGKDKCLTKFKLPDNTVPEDAPYITFPKDGNKYYIAVLNNEFGSTKTNAEKYCALDNK